MEISTTAKKFDIETFMEEIKPAVTEQYEFEYQDKSILITLIQSVGLSRFYCKDQNQKFPKQTLLYKSWVFDWDFGGN